MSDEGRRQGKFVELPAWTFIMVMVSFEEQISRHPGCSMVVLENATSEGYDQKHLNLNTRSQLHLCTLSQKK